MTTREHEPTLPTSNQRPFSLWSFLRNVLHQGESIGLDHRDKPYEQYSARMDQAAREREDELRKGLGLTVETGEQRCTCGEVAVWAYTHSIETRTGTHYPNRPRPCDITPAEKASDSLCPHGMPLAENICGPCSKGEPNALNGPV
jgi:hypothetical protein